MYGPDDIFRLFSIRGIGGALTEGQELHLYGAKLCQRCPAYLTPLVLTWGRIELHKVCRDACNEMSCERRVCLQYQVAGV